MKHEPWPISSKLGSAGTPMSGQNVTRSAPCGARRAGRAGRPATWPAAGRRGSRGRPPGTSTTCWMAAPAEGSDPAASTTTRSASCSASSTSWVTSRDRGARRPCRSSTRSCIRTRVKRVQRGEWLIEQQHTRPADQRSGQSGTLRHPARHLAGAVPANAASPTLEPPRDLGIPLGARGGVRQSEGDVLRERSPRQQPRFLEDHSCSRLDARDPARADQHLPGRGGRSSPATRRNNVDFRARCASSATTPRVDSRSIPASTVCETPPVPNTRDTNADRPVRRAHVCLRSLTKGLSRDGGRRSDEIQSGQAALATVTEVNPRPRHKNVTLRHVVTLCVDTGLTSARSVRSDRTPMARI